MKTATKKAVTRRPFLELEFSTHSDIWDIPTGLSVSDDGQFWMTFADNDPKPRPCTIAEAVAWYVRVEPFAEGAHGSISRLLERALPILEKAT